MSTEARCWQCKEVATGFQTVCWSCLAEVESLRQRLQRADGLLNALLFLDPSDGWWNCLGCGATWRETDPEGEYHTLTKAGKTCPVVAYKRLTGVASQTEEEAENAQPERPVSS